MQDIELRKKIGKLFVVGFHGTVINDEIKEMIEKYFVSNIILFSRNIDNPVQIALLIHNLQKVAKEAGHEQPLLITTDQENGVIRRLVKQMALLPGAMALGATGEADNAYKSYFACGNELHKLGINWNLAPVADVNNNPQNPVIGVRSFGEKPNEVAKFVVKSIEGLHDAKVASTLKHFPGHGDTTTDSHIDLPTITRSIEQLEEVEFIPFGAGISAETDVIMTAHVYFPKIESVNTPASLSNKVMDGLLRDKLGYQGVVITDDLEMKAIADGIGTVAAAELSLVNGSDMVMISHSHDLQKLAFERILKATRSNQALYTKISNSYERVWKLHEKYAQWPEKVFSPNDFEKMVDKDRLLASRLFRKSVTLVKKGSSLPWRKKDKLLVLTFNNQIFSNVEDPNHLKISFNTIVNGYSKNIIYRNFDLTDSLDQIISELPDLQEYDHILLGTLNIKGKADIQARVIRKLSEYNKDIAVIAMRNPYDFNWIPYVETFIATYEFTDVALEIAVSSLFGETLKGNLPITLDKK